MTAVVDYGVGNLFSLVGSLSRIGETAKVTGKREELLSADRIILPGVGAFGEAMDKLRRAGLVDVLREAAGRGIPLLGICLGMQLLFDEGEEFGRHEGLGLIRGRVVSLREQMTQPLKVPHMGWNSLRVVRPCALVTKEDEGKYVYYVHSYCATDCEGTVSATSDYGTAVVGAVARDSVYGMQYHPEKSGEVGLEMLRRFCALKGGERA